MRSIVRKVILKINDAINKKQHTYILNQVQNIANLTKSKGTYDACRFVELSDLGF